MPAEFRSRLYRALAHVPGLAVVDQVADVDGRKGTALALRQGAESWQIIVDPDTGRFLGSRDMLVEPGYGMPAGTVLDYRSVSTTVVSGEGKSN